MLKVIAALAAITLVLAVSACGGDDDDTLNGSVTPGATDATLQSELEAVLLTDADVPDYLQGSGLTFSTNADLAGPNNAEEQQRLDLTGRLLGVDLTFIPTESPPADAVVRGGIQDSASVYTTPEGASLTFQQTAAEARSTPWASSYPELSNVTVNEVPREVGDESVWIRITGFETCAQPTPADATPGFPVETFVCPDARYVVDDYVILRAGRTRTLLKVLSSHPSGADSGVFQDEVQGWADLIVERARATFADPVT